MICAGVKWRPQPVNTQSIFAVFRVSALLLLIVPAWAYAQDMVAMCSTCHGKDGIGISSSIPNIAGVPAIVQEDALFAYADGARKCASSPMMCTLAADLTEEQIIALSAHFAAFPYQAAGEEFDAALAEVGKTVNERSCANCHGADSPDEANSDMGASILHGQPKDYLRYALEQYATGERSQLPMMEKTIAALTSDEIEALLNYYASYRN